jgi:glycosyltransferase involved in cell wall biosynthesis
MRKKILFLLGSYLPKPSANGICCEPIIQKLIEDGHEVSCIAYAEHDSSLIDYIDNTHIYRIKRSFSDRVISWYKSNPSKRLPKIFSRFASIINKFKQILFLPLYPWNSLTYTYKLYKLTMKLQNENKYDAIISVHVPIDTLIVGHLMKKKYPKIKFIPYFLDSLSGGFHLKILPEKWSIQKRLSWEKRLLNNADSIVVMQSSKSHHDKYSKYLGYYNKMEFLDIPLLMDKKKNIDKKKPILFPNKINIVYCGTLNQSQRDPSYILRAFKLLNREDIGLTFIGESDCEDIFNEMKKIFKGELQYLELMPHNEILSILPEANILLNIGVNNSCAISGKIFEYMSYGKPIISTFMIDNEPCIPYLQNYSASLLLDERNINDKEEVEKLNLFINKYKDSYTSNDEVKKKFYNNTPEAFVELVDRVLKN